MCFSEITKLRQKIILLLGDKINLNNEVVDLHEDILHRQKRVCYLSSIFCCQLKILYNFWPQDQILNSIAFVKIKSDSWRYFT